MNIKRFSITIFVLVSAIALGYFVKLQNTVEKDIKAQYLKGGPFELSNEGSVFNLEDLQGTPVILYFGFLNCPDICPVGLAVIRDTLNYDPEFKDVKSLFVTLDPERDNSEKLKEYTAFFHSNIIGLTGSMKEIKIVASNYGTAFRKAPQSLKQDNYSIDHTAYFYIIDKDGDLIRVMDHDSKPEALSEIIKKLL